MNSIHSYPHEPFTFKILCRFIGGVLNACLSLYFFSVIILRDTQKYSCNIIKVVKKLVWIHRWNKGDARHSFHQSKLVIMRPKNRIHIKSKEWYISVKRNCSKGNRTKLYYEQKKYIITVIRKKEYTPLNRWRYSSTCSNTVIVQNIHYCAYLFKYIYMCES